MEYLCLTNHIEGKDIPFRIRRMVLSHMYGAGFVNKWSTRQIYAVFDKMVKNERIVICDDGIRIYTLDEVRKIKKKKHEQEYGHQMNLDEWAAMLNKKEDKK